MARHALSHDDVPGIERLQTRLGQHPVELLVGQVLEEGHARTQILDVSFGDEYVVDGHVPLDPRSRLLRPADPQPVPLLLLLLLPPCRGGVLQLHRVRIDAGVQKLREFLLEYGYARGRARKILHESALGAAVVKVDGGEGENFEGTKEIAVMFARAEFGPGDGKVRQLIVPLHLDEFGGHRLARAAVVGEEFYHHQLVGVGLQKCVVLLLGFDLMYSVTALGGK
mmetsp:Transcript_39670/g.119173  ORF Transcript_39670/g.119173 Transcript_39670/m.119173 type:complete len:225 (+) Transcript_39670:971-1645(+)